MEKVVGIHAVRAALTAGSGRRLVLREGRLNQRQHELQVLAESLGIPVVRDAGLEASQDVLLETGMAGFRKEAELDVCLAENRGSGLFLVLDGITDPRNFGACLRSAASYGVDGVIVAKDRAAPLNEAAVKTASGGASIVPVYQVVNLGRVLNKLKTAGIWLVGTVLDEQAMPLDEIDLTGRVALVMGAEGSGIRQKTQQNCDFLAEIPTRLPDLSLNVSVATGICLYEIHRQRIRV